MPTTADLPGDRAFSILLRADDPSHPGRLAGRLEHVLSGSCHEFDDGQGLLDGLAHERRRAGLVAALRLDAIARADEDDAGR